MRARLRCVSSVIVVVFAVGCAGLRTNRVDDMEIELDVFSGRPNPTWVAAPERAAEITRRLSSLPEAQPQPEPDHLGYRGFIIRQRALQVRVWRGYITMTANGTTRGFVDSTDLEAQLIADATERGFGDALKEMKRP